MLSVRLRLGVAAAPAAMARLRSLGLHHDPGVVNLTWNTLVRPLTYQAG